MAAWSKERTVFKRSNTVIVGSNPAQGMDVCPRFSVLCCPVQVVALRWADSRPRSPTKCPKIDS
jgi:hypothetical protein